MSDIIGALIIAAVVVLVLVFGPGTLISQPGPANQNLCQQRVYLQGQDNPWAGPISCHGKDSVVLVTPTPPQAKR